MYLMKVNENRPLPFGQDIHTNCARSLRGAAALVSLTQERNPRECVATLGLIVCLSLCVSSGPITRLSVLA